MASEWKRTCLSDAIEIISGGTPKTGKSEYWGGNIPWLSVADFNKGCRWVANAEKSITERGVTESATSILNKGDIIISARGTVGVLAQVAKPMAFNQSCYGIRGKTEIAESDFLYYALHHAVSEMKQIANGGVFDTITRDTFRSIDCTLPPLPEQRVIANMLGSLDDRIDHNRALAANLEAIARRLFKSWFVDFDPVRAKAAGEKPAGLVEDIAALFPDRFADSANWGEIPEGWRLESLASVARLNPEAWTTRKHPDEIHYLDLSNVKDGMIEASTRYSWEEAPSRARRVLQQGDTIIGTVRPGNRSFALIDQVGLTGSTGFAVLRPASDGEREYLYLASTSDDAIERLAHLADGAAYPAVRPEVVLATEAIIPGERVMTAFSSVTKGMIDRASVCKQEANVLAGIRDLLLPRLISGKLRVEDAESVIKEAIA